MPSRDRPRIAEGIVNSLAGIDDDPTMLQIDIPIQPGNSGGPLLDSTGAAIGIVTSTLNYKYSIATTGSIPQNVDFPIKTNMLLNLVSLLPTPPALSEITPLDAANAEKIMAISKSAVVKLGTR